MWQSIMWTEILGMIGVFMVLGAYFALQSGWLNGQGVNYALLNLIGATLVMISLLGSDNFAAMALEGAWIMISLYGLYRALKKHHRSPG